MLGEHQDRSADAHAPDFELPGIDEQVYHLTSYREDFRAVGVIFMCNHCPYVRGYLERLKQLQTDFEAQGFTLIGINANDAKKVPEDSFEQMKAFAQERHLNFPYLRDPSQDVALGFGAQKTPEVFLLDREGIVRYRGAIDDNPNDPEAVRQFYLREAIANLLQGEAITRDRTEAVGCSLKWRE
ncbi:thioredoxin family protein [Lusitaniella coriacea LEGE 07157]|uniref:Thioredoxin family protein n=1 Tax=Lusitaniella coriacea LEGE 07157 TaxID=945747 RepID=A0A8J7B8V1_9CYAN|nr:thioredoxin family protein [Lusitaniella coriacea]MBE9115213.1 thioredoxin family protein [Lusitaniella coriacea LEGE 07157]